MWTSTRFVPSPKPGDGVFLPTGTVHSLGGGVVVFEIQQNSDVTFRLYDWNHVDAKTGQPRALQVDAALSCIDFGRVPVRPVPPFVEETIPRRERLLRCEPFSLWPVRSNGPIGVGAVGAARVLVCIEGTGHIEHGGARHQVGRGDTLLLLAVLGPCVFRPERTATLLEIALPETAQVFSFKHPSATELYHDFLWRTTRSLPERGRIGIFNRSYYEEVLIVRVHREILRTERLPDELLRHEKDVWRGRYKSIVDLESDLHRSGTRIVKYFLHLSKEEQRTRFLARIDDPDKNWKLSLGDVEERKFWSRYQEAYEECLSATSTKEAPWYVVPADDKERFAALGIPQTEDTPSCLSGTDPAASAPSLSRWTPLREE